MEIRINPQNVSHIEIYKAHKGREGWYMGGYGNLTWQPKKYFKFLWLFKTNLLHYEEGYYYDNWERSWYYDTPYEIKESEYSLLGEIYTKPKLVIYSGGKEIYREYFEDLEKIKQLCNEKFPHCNVILK